MARKKTELGVDPIVTEAQKRFKRCQDWESTTRERWLDDLKFANADSDNGYQWPGDILRQRQLDDQPCMTINETQQHNLQIINDAKMNKPGIVYRPTGNGATYEAARVLMGLARHIEYISDAQTAYDLATKFQVESGLGWWRVVTRYVEETSFDQEIYIEQIDNPLSVYLDPDIKQFDGSDARFGFVFEDMPREIFEQEFPEWKDKVGPEPIEGAGAALLGWSTETHVRIVEYFRKVISRDKIYAVPTPQGGMKVWRESELTPELREIADQFPSRETTKTEIEWYKIAGGEIIEGPKPWPGSYIPLVRVVGEETKIEGQLDRKGHTRGMKDPQRMYNYWSSAAIEHVALQGKTPYVGPSKAFEGYETYWENANQVNYAYLPYNAYDDEGQQMQPPQRQAPPIMPEAYIQGMTIARQEIMMASGQFQNNMGEQGNERTGKAINERQRMGDKATYHFIDNLAKAVKFTGKILLDLFPKIYDTQRLLSILAEDGETIEVQIDPSARQAFQQRLTQDGQVAQRVLNPGVGQYEVEADVGPAWGTKREEAFNAFTQILTQNPTLTQVIGDLLLQNADFPMADEAAQRLKRLVPAHALGTGPSPEEQALRAQVQNLQALLSDALEQLGAEKGKHKATSQQRDIDAYGKVTDRIQTLIKAIPPEIMSALMVELMMQAQATSDAPGDVIAASQPTLDAAANPPAGRQTFGVDPGDASTALAGGLMTQAQKLLGAGPDGSAPPYPGAVQGPDGNWILHRGKGVLPVGPAARQVPGGQDNG